MKEQTNSIIQTIPAAEALRKVPQFNPLRYLRRTTSKTGEPVLKFDLRYKKMWFRLACSDGRMVLNPMRITDTMAIFEAQLYLHRDDPRPITNFISTMYAKSDSGTVQEQPVAENTYTDDMPIEEITQRMTLDEARAILVTFGTCKGWTLGEVMERRASSLRFYLYSAKDAGNVLKAAASLLLEELAVQKAG